MKYRTPNEGWTKYVSHSKVFDYMADGWMIADDMQDVPHHGQYSVIMWRCDCFEPKKNLADSMRFAV